MADITRLKGITSGESETFRRCGLNTVEDLWLRCAKDNDGITSLASQSKMQKDRLIDLLVAEGMRQPGRFRSAWFKSHWLDILIFGIALVLIVGVWRRW